MRATRVMHVRHSIHLLLVLCTAAGASAVLAQTAGSEPARVAAHAPALPVDKDMGAWLKRMQEAPRRRAYAGTYVVSSSAGALSSARIWHVCDGSQQMERIEALT